MRSCRLHSPPISPGHAECCRHHACPFWADERGRSLREASRRLTCGALDQRKGSNKRDESRGRHHAMRIDSPPPGVANRSNEGARLATERQNNVDRQPEELRGFVGGRNPAGPESAPPRIVRLVRDYSRDMVVEFLQAFPAELEGRISQRRFERTISKLNELLRDAELPGWAHFWYNSLSVLSFYILDAVVMSPYRRRIERASEFIDSENKRFYNPAGCSLRDPREVGFLCLEIEIR